MKTVQQLLDLARTLDPERFASDPEAAVMAAYVVSEAISRAREVTVGKVVIPAESIKVQPPGPSSPGPLPWPFKPMQSEEPVPVPAKRKRKKSHAARAINLEAAEVVLRLGLYLERTLASKNQVGKALDVSSSSISAWLAGRWSPGPQMVKAIRNYLDEREGVKKDEPEK